MHDYALAAIIVENNNSCYNFEFIKLIKMNKISLITPCYNGSSYMLPYIDSLLSQTYSNVEYIFVNDGSTDTTEEIIKSYAEKFREKGWSFTYIRQDQRGGQAKAINCGLKIFSGDYLCCIDSDDLIMPTYLEDLAHYLDEHQECGIVFPWAETIEQNTCKHLSYYKRDIPLHVQDHLFDDIVLQRTCGENYIIYSSYMLRASAFLKMYPGRNIYEGLSGQNAQLILPVLYNYKYGYVKKILYKVVARSDSDSRLSSISELMNKTYSWEDIYCNVISTIPNMPEHEKSFYFSAVKTFWDNRRLNCLKSISEQNKPSPEVKNPSASSTNRSPAKALSLKYKILKVLSYAIMGKLAFSPSKRAYYREKLSKILNFD